jgi:LPS sulfotransferase NodH
MNVCREILIPEVVAQHNPSYREEIKQFFGRSIVDDELKAVKLLFVLFTNRCGSNFICDVFASTGTMNAGGEFFNAPTIKDVASNEALRSLPSYINFLNSHFNYPGYLVSKLAIEQLVMLAEVGLLSRVVNSSYFVLLERRDVVSQAVSRAIADQNKQWIADDNKAIQDESLAYSHIEIQRQIEEITTINRNLAFFLDTNRISYSRIFYEDFLEAPEDHLSDLGQKLGLDNLLWAPSKLQVRRQSNSVKDAWRSRYLRDSSIVVGGSV